MPEKETLERAKKDKSEGKAPSTQAGEFVREEIEHVREGRHGARSTKQAIAIGLSKARRAGVKLASPTEATASKKTREQAQREQSRHYRGKREAQPPAAPRPPVHGQPRRRPRRARNRPFPCLNSDPGNTKILMLREGHVVFSGTKYEFVQFKDSSLHSEVHLNRKLWENRLIKGTRKRN